jgi:NADH-quinone oxidoreductase subunit I
MESAFKKRTSKATVKVVARPESLNKELMLGGIIKGLGVTMRHFFGNVASKKDVATLEYPEQKMKYPERNRGLHRLMHRDDGAVRCVACMCCPTACPAHCITIIPEETGNANEKRPAIFEIDELRCIVCGLCVEACPCDAIRMDTGLHAHPTEKRHTAILGKVDLMKLGTQSVAVQGGKLGWREEAGAAAAQPAAPSAEQPAAKVADKQHHH